jgi:peptidylprolyl isomerase
LAPKSKKSNARRKPPRTRARTAAVARARQQRQRRRGIFTTVAASATVLALVLLMLGAVGAGKSATTTSSTSTTSAPPTTVGLKSVRGKPCLAVSNLPAGAPNVPLQTGPAPTTLVKKDLKVGTGPVVTKNETVTVDYIGVSCSTGKIFDSSYARKQPFTSPLGDLIAGWKQGIPGMRVGGERMLGVPPELAYKSAGRGPDIAPDETLWFVIHVRSAK